MTNLSREATKQKIDQLNRQITELMKPSQFVLNNIVYELLQEVDTLQKQCAHEYDEDGFCVWCYAMKEE